MDALIDRVIERRDTPRFGPEQHRILSARIRPGYDVLVVNISAGGALLESRHRLLPGAVVELHVRNRDHETERVKGRLDRCTVAAVRPDSMCFRGAIVFERPLVWFSGR